MAKLVVREGRDVGTEYVFPPDKQRVVLGRRSSNEIQVMDPKASREHAEVIVEGSRYVLRDLKSRNKTLLNDEPVNADQDIDFGDRIRIGDAVYELVDETKDEPITLQIPGYEILERIGRGSMGTVYRARQLSMDRVVALKVLNEKHSRDEQFIKRFIREARAAGRLSHPNVIHVHDVSDHENTHYFTMEHVDGTTVKKLLKRHGKIDVDRSLDIVLQAAKALEYAHENNIIHRDIKPDNLMLTKDGVVKLADLGIAKLFDEAAEGDGPKRRVFGTPHYMAPEQALGRETDARTDVYSLGATLYHMLTGTTPFQGGTITDILKAHIQSNLQPIQKKAPNVPASVVFMVERMMAKSPEKRYASMEKLAADSEKVIADREADIERLASGESSILPSVGEHLEKEKKRERKRGERARQPRKRPKGLAIAAVVGGLLVLFVLTVLIVRAMFQPPVSAEEAFATIQEVVTERGHGDARELMDDFLRQYPDAPQVQRVREMLATLAAGGDGVPSEDLGPELQRIEELAKSAVLEELERARTDARNFLDRKPPPELAQRARAVVEKAEAALKARREEAAKRALASAMEHAGANPDDLAGQIERFKDVADNYPGTAAGDKAAGRVRLLSMRHKSAMGEAASSGFEKARRAAADSVIKGDYDAAIQAYKGFIAQHGDSELAADARLEVKTLEKEIADAFKKAKGSADRQVKAGLYAQARATMEGFPKRYVSQQWAPEARKLVEELDGQIDAAFEKERARARAGAIGFSYDESIGHYNLLATRFKGTRWESFARSRVQQLEAEKALRKELIRRIGAATGSSAKVLPFIPPGVPESMKKMKWHVSGASERDIVLFPERSRQFLRPVRWGDLPAENLIDLVELYFPKATTEEHLAIAYLCEERGLGERAQMHREAAPDAGGK
ncbi:MAG: protein kinase domain-containing protein [Planctomycetota bacterium]